LRGAGADALNLRIFAPDATSADLVDQIERVGAEVLPALRVHSTGGRTAPRPPDITDGASASR